MTKKTAAPAAKPQANAKPHEIRDGQLDRVAGGFQPQPDPPGRKGYGG